ncbi:MAG: BamA/TamA family outer membrane protein [Bacteroidales bacterium]|nr:BamA/TamA family outer membrane protein [Bacteroidales bacterium]MDD4669409.1 BamA/TamA family outer membrane protein [Bacteroidales bacterium]
MNKRLVFTLIGLIISVYAFAQVVDSTSTNYYGKKKPDVEPNLVAAPISDKEIAKNDIIKKGISLGPLPIVAYDQDRGFEYGALLNVYNFGDGSWYPTPLSTWYFEVSRYTKGTQQYIVSYDNRVLIPGARLSASAEVINDSALDFYGFNGYESFYDKDMPTYFYRMKRLVPSFKVDLTGNIRKNLYWKAGYHFKYFKTEEFVPEDVDGALTLFQLYKKWGIIPDGEKNGGFSSAIRLGLMYDTRNFEAAPSRGIWAEGHVAFAPKFLGTTQGYTKYNLTFRHYLPLAKDRLVFAYRINFQGYIGSAPAFYILPYDTIMGPGYDRDGFGGYRTVRGMLRSRIQGINTGYFNTELRWKFIDFHVLKQNVTLALSGFFDGGRVFKGVNLTLDSEHSNIYPSQYAKYINTGKDKLNDKFHLSAGGGLRVIINQNFIIAFEYGKAFAAQDNNKGALYINTGYLF